MLRGWPAYECGQHPPFNLHAGHTARFLTNSHTSVSRGLVMQKIACLEVGQYECGQGEGDVGRLISQANIRFAYLDSQRRGRVLQEILSWHPSHLSQEFFCVLRIKLTIMKV